MQSIDHGHIESSEDSLEREPTVAGELGNSSETLRDHVAILQEGPDATIPPLDIDRLDADGISEIDSAIQRIPYRKSTDTADSAESIAAASAEDTVLDETNFHRRFESILEEIKRCAGITTTEENGVEKLAIDFGKLKDLDKLHIPLNQMIHLLHMDSKISQRESSLLREKVFQVIRYIETQFDEAIFGMAANLQSIGEVKPEEIEKQKEKVQLNEGLLAFQSYRQILSQASKAVTGMEETLVANAPQD